MEMMIKFTTITAVLFTTIGFHLQVNVLAIDGLEELLLSPVLPNSTIIGPIVRTDKGLVRGNKMVSRSGIDYYAFTSIPYAKPPVGPLRFESPVPAEPWSGIIDGPADLPSCWQTLALDPFRSNVTYGTEDCLYLSVFTPKVGRKHKLPVMIYIYGGAYRSELLSVSQAVRSKYIMDHAVVLVFFTYRLGALGLLSLENDIVPGNMALRDAGLVVKWVSQNIREFGGNPNSITLFGNSVGGVSVHYLLTSPKTKHLVHRGISESGFATCLMALGTPGLGRYRAKTLAQHLNCPVSPDRALIDCLKNRSASDITKSEQIFVRRDFDPIVPYQPVIESGKDCLICESPFNVPVEKPWIVGINKDEGAFKTIWYLVKPELQQTFEEHGADYLPEALMYGNTTTYVRKISEAIITKYKNYKFTDIWTDGYFLKGLLDSLKKAAGPIYMYFFGHRGRTSGIDVESKEGNVNVGDLGVVHTDELLYLFNFEVEKTPEDTKISKEMVKLWTNFAKYGRPTSTKNWPQYDETRKQFLNISSTSFRVDSNLWPDRTNFWNTLPIRNKMERLHI